MDISLFQEGLLEYVCPKCKLIVEHIEYKAICSKCGRNSNTTIFEIYPSLGAVDILYSLYELFELSKGKQKEIIKKINADLKREINKEFDYNKINKILVDAVKIQNDFTNTDSSKLTKTISSKLDLVDKDEINKAHNIISSGDNFNRLYKSIVILSASCIEIVFKDFMFTALIARTGEEIASNIMNLLSNKSIEEHITQLEVFLKIELKNDIGLIEKGFYNEWETLRKQRNKIIHKNSYYVDSDRVNEIFKLAKKSIKVFKLLNNRIFERIT